MSVGNMALPFASRNLLLEAPMHSMLEQLQLAIDPLIPLYLLIDPLVGEPLGSIAGVRAGADPHAQREQAWGRAITPVVLAKTVALPSHQHPYLVTLQGRDDPLLALTLRIAQTEHGAAQANGLEGEGGAAHRIAGCLQTELRAAELADSLSAMCRVNTSARTNATYLRMADRRVLDLLCHVLGAARVAGQFGRLQSWTYLDPHGQIRCLQSTGEQGRPIHLDDQEWQRLERGEMLHRTIAKFLGESARAPASRPQALYPAAEYALADAASAARRWPHRFIGRDDETTWAALLLLYPSVHRLPAVRALLETPESKDEPAEPLRYLHRQIAELAQAAEADRSTR
jgi:hypothetical protein